MPEENESMREAILYTMVGCKGCKTIMKDPELKEDILKGIIEVRECDPDDKKKMKICLEVEKKEDFEGYPTLYNEEGEKLI